MDDLLHRATCTNASSSFELACAIEAAAAARPIRTLDDLDDAVCVQALCDRLACEDECAGSAEEPSSEDLSAPALSFASLEALEERGETRLRPLWPVTRASSAPPTEDEEGPTELDLQLCELEEIADAAEAQARARPVRRVGEQGRARRTLQAEDVALLRRAGYSPRGSAPRA